MVKVTLYGLGCDKCQELHRLLHKVMADHNIRGDVSEEHDRIKMYNKGINEVPALEVNGVLVHKGSKIPTEEELVVMLTDAPCSCTTCE